MANSVERKRSFIINFIYALIIIGLAYCIFKFAFWSLAPFIFALLVAAVLQKPIRKIEDKTNLPHAFVSLGMALIAVLLILGPIATAFGFLINETVQFVKYIAESMNDFGAFVETVQSRLLELLRFLPEKMYNVVSQNLTEFAENLTNDFQLSKLGISMENITGSIGSIISVAKNIPSVALAVIIGIISTFLLTKDYRVMTSFIIRQLPENKKHLLSDVKNTFFNTVGKMIRAYAIIMTITFAELFIGLLILKLLGIFKSDYILVIALGIAIFDIVPLLGAGGILFPWAAYALLTGNYPLAIGLVLMYIVIYILRQYIEPKIVGNQLGIHPLVTLAGLYIGLKLFGFMGMFIVPICLMTLKALNDAGTIHLWKKAKNGENNKDEKNGSTAGTNENETENVKKKENEK